MKKRKFLAFAIALALAGTTGATTLCVNAQGLTQAETPDTVVYGTATAEDIEMLASMFDVEYYKANNQDVVDVLGDDTATLFKHFVLCGVFEGRTCNANFDPSAYASAYDDVKSACGSDILAVYRHYFAIGMTEGRDLTTVAACATKGITVTPLANPDNAVSPAIYYLAQKLGTTDYKALEKSLKAAASQSTSGSGSASGSSASTGTPSNATKTESNSGAVVVTDNGTAVVVVPEGSNTEAYTEANGYEAVGTMQVADEEGNYVTVTLYVVKGETGYASYDEYVSSFDIADKTPVFKTSDYVAGDSAEVIGNVYVYVSAPSESTSSPSTSDMTNRPYYEVEYDSTTEESGVTVNTYASDSEYKTVDSSIVAATDYYKFTDTLAGYYTNAEGTEHHTFESEEERAAWCEANGYTNDYTETYETGVDVNGTADTEYSYGGEIVENEDGSVTVTVAVSSDETEFGYVSEATFTEAEQNTNN